MVSTYFPQRGAIVLAQMRSQGLFPNLAVVSFNLPPGEVAPGSALSLSQGNGTQGTIYYTLDGSDPRIWGGAVAPGAAVYQGDAIVLDRTITVKARVNSAAKWGALTEGRFTVGLKGLVINEIMAENTSILEDPQEPGEFPDWIEIYNGTSGTISLGSMYLTDDLLNLTKWFLSPELSIASKWPPAAKANKAMRRGTGDGIKRGHFHQLQSKASSEKSTPQMWGPAGSARTGGSERVAATLAAPLTATDEWSGQLLRFLEEAASFLTTSSSAP